MAEQTHIYTSWINRISWTNGFNTIIGKDEIKLPCIWYINPTNILEHFGDRIQDILSEVELSRGNRFHQRAHKERFETTHTVLRLLLGQLLVTKPQNIAFEKGHHNKPLLATRNLQDIHFNLSYTANGALIAVDTDYPIGIDIERVNKAFDYHDMQEVCFSKREIEYIALHRQDSTLRFFTLWTRKEAILKLTGEGIGEHLPAFEVLDGNTEAAKQIIGKNPPNDIHIYTFRIGSDYIGSLATERPQIAPNFYQL